MLLPCQLADGLPDGRPLPVRVLSRATLPGGDRADVVLHGGSVVALSQAGTETGSQVLDLDGYVVMPAAADPHSHLDKALSLGTMPPAYGDLRHAIEQWLVRGARSDEEDYRQRAGRAAREMVAHGITAIRSHCNLTEGPDPLVALRALTKLKAELAELLDLEIAVLPAWQAETADIAKAMEHGADIVGACPHLAPDPHYELDRALKLAYRYGTGVDIHADEQLTPGMLSVRELAQRVSKRPVSGTVVAGHCVSLGCLEQPLLAEVLCDLAAAGVGVVTLPITNLFLQGWEHPVMTPRGLTAVRALLDAGVTLGAGGDNIRDPFNPVGRADPLETASLLVTAGHLTIEESVDAVTHGSRQVLGLPRAGAEVGAVADLLACQGESLADVVARAPEDRVVLKAGKVVSVTATHRALAG